MENTCFTKKIFNSPILAQSPPNFFWWQIGIVSISEKYFSTDRPHSGHSISSQIWKTPQKWRFFVLFWPIGHLQSPINLQVNRQTCQKYFSGMLNTPKLRQKKFCGHQKKIRFFTIFWRHHGQKWAKIGHFWPFCDFRNVTKWPVNRQSGQKYFSGTSTIQNLHQKKFGDHWTKIRFSKNKS